MCNPNPLRNWLIAIAGTITTAASMIGVAIALNGSPKPYLAPAFMFTAAGFTGLAVLWCGFAINALNVLDACTGKRCIGQSGNIRRVLIAAGTILGIQATACGIVALVSAVPFLSQPAMWVIFGALLVQVALILTAIAFFNNLATCARSAG
jgi:hypothetical protein